MLPNLIHHKFDNTHLFATRFDQHRAENFLAYLSAEEKVEAKKKATAQLREQKILSYGLRRKILGEYLKASPAALKFSLIANQKPILVEGPEFNVSHTETHWVMAVHAHHPVGVDIESTTRQVNFLELAKRFFAAEEFESLTESSRPAEVFWRLWTAKEALLKATGQGIVGGLDKIILRVDEKENYQIKAPQELAQKYSLKKLVLFPDTILTITIPST